MSFVSSLRSRARRLWRAVWPVAVVAGGTVMCDSPMAPKPVNIAFQPVVDLAFISQFAGLAIDHARIVVVQPPSDTLYNSIVNFSVDLPVLDISIPVDISGTQTLDVTFELLAGTQVMFTGSQQVTATPGAVTPPPTITPTFVGPGSQVATLTITPRDSIVTAGGQVTFAVAAADSSAGAVNSFYSSWSTTGTSNTINAQGLFRAGNTPGAVWVYARTPNGVADSTQITVVQPGQSGSISLSLPGNLVAVGGAAALSVNLSQPAPAGGLVVSLTSDSAQYISIAAPGTVTFTAGQSTKTIQVTGVAIGASIIHATAPGWNAGILGLGAAPPTIILQPSVTVAAGGTSSMSVQLLPVSATPVTVTLTSGDTSLATVTPTLNFAANQSSQNATVTGKAAGSLAITASAPGFNPGGSAVTVTSAAAVPTTLVKFAGDNQTAIRGDTTAIRLQARVLDAGGQPMTGVSVQFTIASGAGHFGAAGTTSTVATNASGIAIAAAWTLGAAPGANSVTATVPGTPAVPSVTFTATGQLPPPVIALSIFGSTVVGQARTGQLNVKLLQPAPAGGVTVALTTTRPGYLRIGSYASESGTAPIAAGDSIAIVTVFGDSVTTGVDTVIATAPGYTPDTLAVPVSINLISLPTTLNVPLNQTANLGITISTPAPAGGVQLAVSSVDPTRVQVQTPTVTIPQGSTVGSATLFGTGLGSTSVSVTNPNYAPFSSTVSTTASLNITVTSVSLNASFGSPVVVQLESGGTPVAAPAGGVPITMTPRNPACAAAPGANLAQGVVSASVAITYGGSATLPCSTYVVASGPAGFVIDSVLANVAVQPALSVSPQILGSGLQRAVGFGLGASNHGGTTVRVTSTDPSVALIATSDSTPGAAFQDIPINVGVASGGFYVQALEGITDDTSLIIVSAPGFVPDTAAQRVLTAVFDLIFLNGSGNTRTANDAFQARTGSPSSPTSGISVEDAIRVGGTPLVVSVINDSTAVGKLVTTATGAAGADSVTTTVAPRLARSPSTVATGGVEFRYAGAGVTRVHAQAPNFRPVGTALGQNVTVTAPAISHGNVNIGAMLQRQVFVNVGASAVAGDTATVKLSRSGVARIGPNDSTFADSIQVALTPGSSSFSYYVSGVDTVTADSVNVSVTVPGFTQATAKITVFRPVFDIIFLTSSGTTRTANDAFQVRSGTPSSATGGISVEDVIRFGAPPQTFTIVNDSSSVGKLVTTATGAAGADTATVQIAARTARSPSTAATGGVEFKFTGGGVTRVHASNPVFRAVGPAAGQNITVSAPAVFASNQIIGAMLQRNVGASMGAAAITGDTATVVVLSPGVVKVGASDSVVGDTARIALSNGSSSFSFWIQGGDTVTTADSSRIAISIPGFTPDTMIVGVYRPVVDLIFIQTNATSLDANDVFQARIGTPSSPTGGISIEDQLRFGAPPQTFTVSTTTPTVAQLVTQTQSGNNVDVQIVARGTRSPASFATGGVEQDFLTTGTTVLSASAPGFRSVGTATGQTVTVVAPAVTVSASTVGSGLQESRSGSLSAPVPAGGATLVIKSSNPGQLLVSPNVSTPGTDSIVVALTPGTSGFNYYVQGVEGLTGAPAQVSVTATVTGYTQGTATVTVVQPAVDVIFLPSNPSQSAPNSAFQVRLGYANSPTNSGMQVEQELRAGLSGPVTVTITSTNSSAATLVTSAAPAGAPSVTVQIQPGQARSPNTIASGGVQADWLAQGVTFIVPTITNFITVKQTAPNTQPGFGVTVGP